MTDKIASRKRPKESIAANGIERLYRAFLRSFYDEANRAKAKKIGARLAASALRQPEFADSIRGEEVRSLLAELRGDLAEAISSRESEIRKIFELHSLARETPSWGAVFRLYDFSDIGDRLDLLAVLYSQANDLERAVKTLKESKHFCDSHHVPFDGQDLLDEYEESLRRTAAKKVESLVIRENSAKR